MPRIFIAACLALLTSCTTITVDKLDRSLHPVDTICIRTNPKVIVPKFTDVLVDGFRRHGIRPRVFQGSTMPSECEYVLTYTARRSWDLAPFLSYVELNVYRRNEKVASATYEHSGGLAFNKWADPEDKLEPVFDELLVDFRKR